MDELQREADQDQANSEDAHAVLGHIISKSHALAIATTSKSPVLYPNAQRLRPLMRVIVI